MSKCDLSAHAPGSPCRSRATQPRRRSVAPSTATAIASYERESSRTWFGRRECSWGVISARREGADRSDDRPPYPLDLDSWVPHSLSLHFWGPAGAFRCQVLVSTDLRASQRIPLRREAKPSKGRRSRIYS